jgi:hypothetical protein
VLERLDRELVGLVPVKTIEILLQIMENNRDDLVVILAGYKDYDADDTPSANGSPDEDDKVEAAKGG